LWISIDGVKNLWASLLPHYLIYGFVFFSIPLMGILGIHELGHYFVSKRHGVNTSLPFFIPLPPIPFPLGTLGAVISMREPIPNRKALLDIGAAGPICGFITSIPVILIGFFLMQEYPLYPPPGAPPSFSIMYPLLLDGLSKFFSIPSGTLIHPTAFAGWVGIFVTSINLLPVGQLDGGHVARAALKEKHKYASWAAVALMLGLGIFYTGWLFMAFIVLLLIGTRHPPPLNEAIPLDSKSKWIIFAVGLIFALSFVPIPFSS
jgi:membrane-associated protease RseP (regulator of RpoE activity)